MTKGHEIYIYLTATWNTINTSSIANGIERMLLLGIEIFFPFFAVDEETFKGIEILRTDS